MIPAMKNSRVRVAFLGALVLLGRTIEGAMGPGQQGPSSGAIFSGADPVPPENVNGRQLTMPERNFSMVAPADECIWIRSSGGSLEPGTADQFTCLCRSLKLRLAVTVRNLQGQKAEAFPAAHVDSLRKRMGTGPFDTKITAFESVDTPLPGSLRFSLMTPTRAGDVPTGAVAIAAAGSYGYIFETQQDSDTFRAFVGSFRLLSAGR